VVGQSKGFNLFGLTVVYPATLNKAIGRMYATVAMPAGLAVWYGFKHLKLTRFSARHWISNRASGRVLAKLGVKQEGLTRKGVKKSKGFEDMVLVALLREEWQELCRK
jgi:[ribosomal protein S5]-alanine N-acetyltransferase